jgi:hypothetical protein
LCYGLTVTICKGGVTVRSKYEHAIDTGYLDIENDDALVRADFGAERCGVLRGGPSVPTLIALRKAPNSFAKFMRDILAVVAR